MANVKPLALRGPAMMETGGATKPSLHQLPRFLIVGGMKCGTTTLHRILSHHPDVFIPEDESHFFTIDDIEQNADFFLRAASGWPLWDFDQNFDEYLLWYASFFKTAAVGKLIGEDCVSYMYSKNAAQRIASLLPDVKLICMLRDPVLRTYSHYWHLVKTNRAFYSFEDTLQFAPQRILDRSMYVKHLAAFLSHFRRDQIKFVLLDQYIADPQKTVDAVCDFLNIRRCLDMNRIPNHVNRALVPRHAGLQLFYNRLVGRIVAGRKYRSFHLPNADRQNWPVLATLNRKIVEPLLLTDNRPYPPMQSETRYFLEHIFRKENRGLAQLIGIDVETYWPYMR